MSFRERIVSSQFEARSIALATHLGTTIQNETGPADLALSHQSRMRDQRFEALGLTRRRPAIHGYNCFGMVFANRRTGIYEGLDLALLVHEDGMAEVRAEDAMVGDIVIYEDDRGEDVHAARIVRFEAVLAGSSNRDAVVLSKFDSTSGEFEHRIEDIRWCGGEKLRVTIYRERAKAPTRKPSGFREVLAR